MDAAKNMDSVFSEFTNDEIEFDVFFDQEDQLIDTVVGVNENGDPLTGVDFEELHQTDEDVDVDDIKDELGPDSEEHDMGNKDAEGTDEKDLCDCQTIDNLEKNGESEAEKEIDTPEVEDDYQDGKADGTAPKADQVTDTVEAELKESADDLMPEEEDHCDIDDDLDPVSAPSADGTDKDQPVAGEVPSEKGKEEVNKDLVGDSESQEKITNTAESVEETDCPECSEEELIEKITAMGYTVTKKTEEEDTSDELSDDDVMNHANGTNEEEPEVQTSVNASDAEGEAPVDAEPAAQEEVNPEELAAKLASLGYKIVKVEEPAAEAPTSECNEAGEVPVEGTEEKPSDIDDELDDDVAPEGDDEYNSTDTAAVKEDAATEVDDIDDELDDDTVEDAENDVDPSVDLTYDPSDEDLIDIAIGK